ncbi:MAG: hypothetical protein AB8B61_06590, partial [Cyclobacteriaceae bacterium]
MKKLFFHIILLLFTSSFPVLVNAQFYIDNTVISIDSTELKVDSMNTEIAIGGQLTLHGNDKALFYHAGDTLRNHDTIVSNGKIILESAYIASNTNALISNADSLISKGNWENALGDYSGAGVISFASIADTQFISNKPDEEGLVSVHIDGGSRKMISGNFFSINLHLKNGIIEPLTATDSIGVGFNPNIVQEDTLSFVEGKFHNQDTGSVYFPIGSDGKFRPVELRNVAEPPGWTFMTGFGPVAEANWDLLPFVSAVTGEYFLSEQTSDNNYVTFAKRYWEFDTLQGSLDGAVSRLYYNGDQDMPSGAVFTPSELIVMNADGNLTSSTYDTLGLSDSGSIASFNLDFIESNPFVGGAYNPFFYIGLKTGTCPGLVAAIKFSVSSDSAHLCPGEITNLFVDTTGTSDPSIVLNNALWQDSTENTTLTYSVSGAGVYRSIVTYNSVCKDTADNLFVSYNRTPSLDFVDNTFVTNTRIVDTLYSNSAATYSLFDIAETRNGDIYMTDTVNNQLVKLTKLDSSLTETTIPSVILPLNSPMGIASYKNKVFVADRDNKRIRMTRPLLPNILGVYAGSGGTADTTRQGTDRKSSIFESPIDIAIDSSAIMYVADNTLNAIRVISPFSGYTTIGKLPTDTVTDGNTFENHAFTNLKALTVTNDNKLIIIDGLTIKEADLTTDSIKIINGGAPSFIAPLASVDLSSVNNIYSFDNGAISFSSSATHEIILYNTSTNEYSLGAGVNGPGGFKNGATDTALFNLPQGSIVSNFGGRGFLTVDQGNK